MGEGAVDDRLIEPGRGRRHPTWGLWVLRDRQPLAVEQLERARPPERSAAILQHPPAPAGGPDGGLHVDNRDLAPSGFPQLHQVDVGTLVDGPATSTVVSPLKEPSGAAQE